MNQQNGLVDGRPTQRSSQPDSPSGASPFWKRRRFRTGVVLTGVFLVGACLGSFGTSYFIYCHIKRFFGDSKVVAKHILCHMRRDIDLTDEQVEQIRPRLVTLHRRIKEAILREHDAAMSDIEQCLSEEQLVRHRKGVEERRRRFLPAGERPHDNGTQHTPQ